MNLLDEGIKRKLIRFEDDSKYIVYLNENKRRNYSNPEEKVQAETFLKLIIAYKYDPKKIRQFVPVTMGSDVKEADIVVYNDFACTQPHIVVECKKEEVSELEFQQAVKQGFAYAYALSGTIKYVWVTSKIKNEYYRVDKDSDKKTAEPDIPQCGVTKLAKYKYAKGGGEVGGQRLFDLEVVTEDELTRRFKQAHQALWGGGELNPSEAFDELDKLIFCKIWDERKPRKKGEPYDFQVFAEKTQSQTDNELIKRVEELYEEGRKVDKEVFKDRIRLSAQKCRTVVGYLEAINLSKTDLDSKGRAFETFMGSFFRGDFGQYFTPRKIVEFVVNVLPIQHDSLVLDTSCGSGGFLLHALDKVRKEAGEYYAEGSAEHYKHWHDFAEKNLFGIEINEQIARTAKMNMIIHDDGHTNVIACDGLLEDKEIQLRTHNRGFEYGTFDFIITNPPFGSTVKQTESAYLHQYRMSAKEPDWLSKDWGSTAWLDTSSDKGKRPNQSTEVLFIEQCHRFLRDGGYLAVVVPDGILTNSSLQYVRDNIEEMYQIVAVVSMPQTAFAATGAGVKSSVLFLKKHSEKETERIRDAKEALKNEILDKNGFWKEHDRIQAAKNKHLKSLKGFTPPSGVPVKELPKSEAFQEWKKSVNDQYSEQLNVVKEKLAEQWDARRRSLAGDYDIFMAIAEDIGYDATGKPTGNNELEIIGQELARFIQSVEEDEA